MTVTTECSPSAEVAGEGLLTALMSGRDGDGEPGIKRPLLLDALMRRRRGREVGIGQPVLAAALPGRH
jgi:hypothetical protein